jgi:hypothetical protein
MTTTEWLTAELAAGLVMLLACRSDVWRLAGLCMAGTAALCLLGWP